MTAYWSGGRGSCFFSLAPLLREEVRLPLDVPFRNRRGLTLAGNANLIAVCEAVGGCYDNAIVRGYARAQFDIAPEIAGDGHGLEQYLVVRADRRDPKAALVEDQGARGNVKRRGIACERHAHIGIAARHQLSA